MKTRFYSFLFTGSLFFLSSCGLGAAMVLNHHATQVNLASNNFRVVDKVSGSAEVEYVLIFGGMHRKQIYENAYAAMVRHANLQEGSRALANVITEEHIGGVPPFYYRRTITVSAHVVEFIK